MKVKRFNNLWAMGLILCGALLIAFYVAKIFFPEFIIGIAETPKLIEWGTVIQSNKWYLHLFNFGMAYIHGYIMCCACLRKKYLNLKDNLIFLAEILVLRVIFEFYPLQYSVLNVAGMVITPFLMALANKCVSKEIFVSTIVCFGLELAFEFFSLIVRDLTKITTMPNVVNMIILTIDLLIWRILLYFFFNYKNKNKGD